MKPTPAQRRLLEAMEDGWSPEMLVKIHDREDGDYYYLHHAKERVHRKTAEAVIAQNWVRLWEGNYADYVQKYRLSDAGRQVLG